DHLALARPPSIHDLLVQQALPREIQDELARPELERRAARGLAERVTACEDAPAEGGPRRTSRDDEIDLLRVRDRPCEHDAAVAHAATEPSRPVDEPYGLRVAEPDLVADRRRLRRAGGATLNRSGRVVAAEDDAGCHAATGSSGGREDERRSAPLSHLGAK